MYVLDLPLRDPIAVDDDALGLDPVGLLELDEEVLHSLAQALHRRNER
jgi:hypothetical protein